VWEVVTYGWSSLVDLIEGRHRGAAAQAGLEVVEQILTLPMTASAPNRPYSRVAPSGHSTATGTPLCRA
jgi:hypothetical protein